MCVEVRAVNHSVTSDLHPNVNCCFVNSQQIIADSVPVPDPVPILVPDFGEVSNTDPYPDHI